MATVAQHGFEPALPQVTVRTSMISGIYLGAHLFRLTELERITEESKKQMTSDPD
jgi:hypothetical protein